MLDNEKSVFEMDSDDLVQRFVNEDTEVGDGIDEEKIRSGEREINYADVTFSCGEGRETVTLMWNGPSLPMSEEGWQLTGDSRKIIRRNGHEYRREYGAMNKSYLTEEKIREIMQEEGGFDYVE